MSESHWQLIREAAGRRRLALIVSVAGASWLAACAEPVQPRNFADFMEDRIAREGTLVRCNADREATLNDIECANARRAAAAIALRRERDQREVLERESATKLAALRNQIEARERRAAAEAELAQAEQERAYNNLWGESDRTLAPIELPPGSSRRPAGADAEVVQPQLEEVRPSRFGWRSALQ